MTVTRSGRVALLCALATSVANAQTPPPAPAAPPAANQAVTRPAAAPAQKPVAATPAPASAQTPKAAPAAPAPSAARAPAAPLPAPAAKPAAPAPAPAASAGMSESKYLALLYAEIARHTPEENAAGPGEVTASFIVGPAGKVTKVTIDKTSSPAHAEVVKKILSEVAAPAPPGGSMDVGQTFKFR